MLQQPRDRRTAALTVVDSRFRGHHPRIIGSAIGILGKELTAKSPPDGHTFLIIGGGFAIKGSMYRKCRLTRSAISQRCRWSAPAAM